MGRRNNPVHLKKSGVTMSQSPAGGSEGRHSAALQKPPTGTRALSTANIVSKGDRASSRERPVSSTSTGGYLSALDDDVVAFESVSIIPFYRTPYLTFTATRFDKPSKTSIFVSRTGTSSE
jgi:hypothetical protein